MTPSVVVPSCLDVNTSPRDLLACEMDPPTGNLIFWTCNKQAWKSIRHKYKMNDSYSNVYKHRVCIGHTRELAERHNDVKISITDACRWRRIFTCQEKAKESQCITIFRCYTGQLVILESYPMKLSPNLHFYHYNNINFNSLKWRCFVKIFAINFNWKLIGKTWPISNLFLYLCRTL